MTIPPIVTELNYTWIYLRGLSPMTIPPIAILSQACSL